MSLTASSQSSNHKSTLAAGEYLNVNDALISDNGANQAILHPDCTFVVFNGGTQVWTSFHFIPAQAPSCFAVMQADGNFVLYLGTPQQPGPAVWASGTSGPSPLPFFLTMQDDGNLVIYKGTATWATGTSVTTAPRLVPSANRSTLAAGETLVAAPGAILLADNSLSSDSGRYVAFMQAVRTGITTWSDGDFVIKEGAAQIWHSDTSLGQGNYFAKMQTDGTFVLYKGTPQQPGAAYWAVGTSVTSPSPFFLTMQDDGNLVIYKGSPTWSTTPVVSPPPPPPPNPISISLGPFFAQQAPRTVYYTGMSPYPNINGSYGCSNPKITTVTNRSAFVINLNYGSQGDITLAHLMNPNDSLSVFQGDDPSGGWEAWGPESGNLTNKQYSLPIDINWTC